MWHLLAVAGIVFLAAAVEWVEALTIVLAVGLFKGWRSAIAGTVAATLALAGLVLIFGVALASLIPLDIARTVVGVFLLLFGLKWLHKAILRSSGLKPLHDEAAAFEKERQRLLGQASVLPGGLDGVGVATAFNGVLLEGLEVVFICIALGGTSLAGAALGAAVSVLAVVAVGLAFRAPLTRVPENAMKYVVGVLLTAFGTFFAGEGIGVRWWQQDLSILGLIALYGLGSVIVVQVLKRPRRTAGGPSPAPVRLMRAVAAEVWGLFVGDSALALVAVAALLAVALFAQTRHQGAAAGYLLVAGVMLALLVGFIEPYRKRPSVAPRQEAADAVRSTHPSPTTPAD